MRYLSLACILVFAGCANNPSPTVPQQPEQSKPGPNDTTGKDVAYGCCEPEYDSLFQEKVYYYVDQPPVFQGGEDALNMFLAKQLRYPKLEENDRIQGKIVMAFIVNKDGSIRDARISGKPASEWSKLDKEGLRVVNMMPKWKPGRCQGKAVSVAFYLPLFVDPSLTD